MSYYFQLLYSEKEWLVIINNNCNNLAIDGVKKSLSSFFTFFEVEDYIVKIPMRRIHIIKTDNYSYFP